MDDFTRIDVPAVYRMSEATLDAAGRLERLAARVEATEEEGRTAVAGSKTCDPTVTMAAHHWWHLLRRLAEEVRGFGAGLEKAATDYRESDAAASGRVRGAGLR